MKMNLPLICLALGALWCIHAWPWSLYRNYRAAKRSGLPVYICPFSPSNILFIFFGGPFRLILSIFSPDVATLSKHGWQLHERYALHDRLGKTFILVTPGTNQLWTADPAMAQILLARRKNFGQLDFISHVLAFAGRNLVTANGDDWARQRRFVAPQLNERISQAVWEESKTQASGMGEYMLNKDNGVSQDSLYGLKSVAINVLGQVAYGKKKAFELFELPKDPKGDMTYVEAVAFACEHLIFYLLPSWLIKLPFMPNAMQVAASAFQRIPNLTKTMLDQERDRSQLESGSHSNIMSMMVEQDDISPADGKGEKAAATGRYLTEEEIAGNLAIFTAAGFDTTTNTLAYALTLLMAHPEWQSWIQEEIDFVCGPENSTQDLDYTGTFPKLTRCMAVMLETLRLFPALPSISRTMEGPQTITVHEKTHSLEAPLNIFINVFTLHSHPSTWGGDSLTFRPSRWMAEGSKLGASDIAMPPRGTYSPWSGGPRTCPGQKMAQVEFVAVLMTLFSKYKVEPVVKAGESMEQAEARLLKETEDSEQRFTMQIRNPSNVRLRWSKRSC